MAQIRGIYEALEKITKPSNKWNRSLQSLKAEAAARRAPQLPESGAGSS
jgi:hypothetical protein